MAKFCFYYGGDEGVLRRMREAALFCWENFQESARGSFHLFLAADDREKSFCETDSEIGALSGYARFGEKGNADCGRRFFAEISRGKWALGERWTGSFAAVAYSEKTGEITLCNDVLGHYPLYYAGRGEGFAGGTSLIVLSRALRSEPDAVGVLQRITVPFCNYGRRTMLGNVFRLLPGERLKWKRGGIRYEYDDSLCGDVVEPDLKTAARLVWDCLQGEIAAALGDANRIALAMSGGWDSRLILGGVRERGAAVKCLTYGSEDHYETRIVRRCAEAVGASHECFPIENKYFPSRAEIEPLVRETESANYFEWFGIIEKARAENEKIPLLLGDLCESIDGRYMTAFSARKARVRSFLRGLAGFDESFAPASAESFERWREAKKNEITAALLKNLKNLSGSLIGTLTEDRIAAEIESDLNLSFERVRMQKPHFAAAYDELFIWFHAVRFLLGNQITWLGAAFHPVSPGLSMRFLRFITTLHPSLKIKKRLMNAIIRLPEFDRLARIPSAQIPLVSSRAPAFIKDVFWAARFGCDQILIRRTLRRKNAGRQRLLRSLDYVREYRRERSASNVEGWFSGENIKSENYLRIFRERAALDTWTLINVDIAAPANASIILDLCRAEAASATASVQVAGI